MAPFFLPSAHAAAIVFSGLERLEPRFAPAGLVALPGAEVAHSFPAADLDAVGSLHAPTAPPALTPSPTAPEIFSSVHPGFVLRSASAEFDTAGFKGVVDSLVVRRTATTDALNQPVGGLDFYYQLRVTSGDPRASVDALTFTDWAPFLVDAGVDHRLGPIVSSDALNGRNGGTQFPVLFSYQAGTAQFSFTGAGLDEALTLAEPESRWLVLRTNARSFDTEGSARIDGEVPAVGSFTTTVALPGPDATPVVPQPLIVAGSATSSRVQVFDPATGALRESFSAFGVRSRSGVRVATGDVNGDGVEDIIVGSGGHSPGGAQVRVFDGADPAHPPLAGVLGSFRPFGRGYAGAVNVASGDVNGDGYADIIVAPGAGSSGQVRVFSGLDGTLLSRFTALSKVNGGVRVAGGDLDGDGRDEVIVGSGIGSAVRVFHGLTGAPLPGLSFQAFETSYTGGVNVAAGDVNGDGIDELFVGNSVGPGRVRIFDHALARLAEIQTASTAGVRLAVADVNGDTFADLIVGQAVGGTNAASVFDGLSRAKRFDLSGYPISKTSGLFIG